MTQHQEPQEPRKPLKNKRNYKLSILRRLARYIHPLITKRETRIIDRSTLVEERHPIIFIVGAPRTGSTILYQMLTNYLDIQYIDNLSAIFYRNLYFGMWLSFLVYRRLPHHSFASSRGNTQEHGLHAPSECGDFWYRWLPRDHHHIERDEIPVNHREQIRRNLVSIINRYDRPLIIKNLNAGQRMKMISQIMPNARFIFIKRSPLYTGQSIWLSKEKAGLQPHQWWSIMPPNVQKLETLPPHEQIVKQIYYLEKQILQDATNFPPENFTSVTYEALCRDPLGTIERLQSFIGPNVKTRKGGEKLPEPKFSESQKIIDHDFLLLNKQIQQLDWERYTT